MRRSKIKRFGYEPSRQANRGRNMRSRYPTGRFDHGTRSSRTADSPTSQLPTISLSALKRKSCHRRCQKRARRAVVRPNEPREEKALLDSELLSHLWRRHEHEKPTHGGFSLHPRSAQTDVVNSTPSWYDQRQRITRAEQATRSFELVNTA